MKKYIAIVIAFLICIDSIMIYMILSSENKWSIAIDIAIFSIFIFIAGYNMGKEKRALK